MQLDNYREEEIPLFFFYRKVLTSYFLCAILCAKEEIGMKAIRNTKEFRNEIIRVKNELDKKIDLEIAKGDDRSSTALSLMLGFNDSINIMLDSDKTFFIMEESRFMDLLEHNVMMEGYDARLV